jgi:hypothetical protein
MSTSPISAGASSPIGNPPPVGGPIGAHPRLAARVCDGSTGLSFGAIARRAAGQGVPIVDAGGERTTPGGRSPGLERAADATSIGPGESRPEDRGGGAGRTGAITDLVDPLALALASPHAGRGEIVSVSEGGPAASADAVALATRVSLEQMLSRLVRRIAWSGDAHTGSARIELGSGVLDGATLVIHSDHGALSVSLDLPPGVDRAEWRERIASRLNARGLHVAALEVE